jgi:hypothetical protein
VGTVRSNHVPAALAVRRPPRRLAGLAVLAAATLALAGCTSSPPAAADTAPPDNALSGVTVPDAYTAVVIRSVSEPTFPFLGTDGKYHVAYDLELTNAGRAPATIDKLDVVDAHNPSTVILSYSGTKLVDPSCPFGDCNRLRALPSAPTTSTTIPPQESRALYVDFAVDAPDQAPKAVLHHLYGQAAVNPGATAPTAVDYLAAPLDISAGTPRVIGSPLKGDRWVAANGCCLPGFPHRSSLAAFNGQLVNSQRFAIDWMRLDENGQFYEGDKTKNESYADYDQGVYAVADGTITAALNTLDPGTPGVLPASDPVLGPQITVKTVDGNHLVEDIGGGAYAFYAHLIKGTLLVNVGDKVTKGQMIAKLGNTGNSSVPHLHFHLMDGPSVLGSDGLPYVIDQFSYDGQVDPQALVAADDNLTGRFDQGKLPQAQPRTDQLPLNLAVINFPS